MENEAAIIKKLEKYLRQYLRIIKNPSPGELHDYALNCFISKHFPTTEEQVFASNYLRTVLSENPMIN